MDKSAAPFPPSPEIAEDELALFAPPSVETLRLVHQGQQIEQGPQAPLRVTLPVPSPEQLLTRPYTSECLHWVMAVLEMHNGVSASKTERLKAAVAEIEDHKVRGGVSPPACVLRSKPHMRPRTASG